MNISAPYTFSVVGRVLSKCPALHSEPIAYHSIPLTLYSSPPCTTGKGLALKELRGRLAILVCTHTVLGETIQLFLITVAGGSSCSCGPNRDGEEPRICLSI